jgi:large subunit ribosomal protein L16
MLYPKKVKFRKWQRMRKNPKKLKVETRGTTLAFGSFGLKAEEARWLTSQQIEACRKALARYTQKSGRVWIRIFPDKPITSRPPEVTMGGGKGDPSGFVASVKPGRILFEIDGLSEETAKEALQRAAGKLPIKTRIIIRN